MSTALPPFWKTGDCYWTSYFLYHTFSMNYSYPDFNGVDTRDLDAMQERAALVVRQKYSPCFLEELSGTTAQAPTHLLRDWTARIRVKKYNAIGSFSVLIFLGDPPSDPDEWRSCEAYVGGFHVLVNSAAERCGNCRKQRDIIVEGFVHLTEEILVEITSRIKSKENKWYTQREC